MIEKVKQLRVRIDGLIKESEMFSEFIFISDAFLPEIIGIDIKSYINAQSELFLAKGWLGKMLADNPYHVVKKAEDIPNTADTAEVIESSFTDELMFLNNQREQLGGNGEGLVDEVGDLLDSLNKEGLKLRCEQAWIHLNNASMYYGQALGNLRDRAKIFA